MTALDAQMAQAQCLLEIVESEFEIEDFVIDLINKAHAQGFQDGLAYAKHKAEFYD